MIAMKPLHAVALAAAIACPAAAQAAERVVLVFTGVATTGSYGVVNPYTFPPYPDSTSFVGQPVALSLAITRAGGDTYVDSFNLNWSHQTYDLPYVTAWDGEGLPSDPINDGFFGYQSHVTLGSSGGAIDVHPTSDFSAVTDAAFGLALNFSYGVPHDPFTSFTDDALTGGGALDAGVVWWIDPVIGPYDADSFVNFDLTSVTQTRIAGVPEPATWALMLLGFAGVGLASRREARRLRAG